MSLSAPESPSSSTALPWHSETAESAGLRLEVDPATGLTAAEAQSRLQRHGPNRLAEPAPRPVWLKFLDQFRSFLVIVLLGAAVLAGAVGDLKDAVVIAIVVVINALILIEASLLSHGLGTLTIPTKTSVEQRRKAK